MKILIIGKGSVGRTLAQFHPNDTIAYYDPNIGEYAIVTTSYDVGHITYPMEDLISWIELTKDYMKAFSKVKWWMIHSTILPEALDYLPKDILIVYSPIRATEAIMDSMVAKYRKFWAFINKSWDFRPIDDPLSVDGYMIENYLEDHFPNPLQFKDAKDLVLGKLLETADFGMQIMFAQMVFRMVGDITIERFNEVYRIYRQYSEYGADYSNLDNDAPKEWIPRGLFRPDVIRGKCVMQNIKLLSDAGLGDAKLWQQIIESNEKQKRIALKK